MQVDIFSEKVASIIDIKRIVSFLYFGSNAFNINNHKFSDYDFLLLLDGYDALDLHKLRKIVRLSSFRKFDINLNIIYKTDLENRGSKNFQLRSLRPDFYKYLEGAKVLLGTNYFRENHLIIRKRKLVKYCDFKIQEYYGRCDKLFLLEKDKNNLIRKIKKYTNEMIRMFLIKQNDMTIKEIDKKSYSEIYGLALKNKYMNKTTINHLISNNLMELETARRSVYETYLKKFGIASY